MSRDDEYGPKVLYSSFLFIAISNVFHLSKIQLISIFAAVAIVVLLLFAPNKPPLGKEVTREAADKPVNGQELEEAIALVEQGTDPMKGVMMLREIIRKDSGNVKAHYYLGEFSMQSGQWEKARQRFLKVIELDSSMHEAFLKLAITNSNLGDTAAAIANYATYKSHLRDEKHREEVQIIINELKK